MDIGIIGLGKMGGNMTRRLLDGGHRVTAYDPSAEAVKAVVKYGATGASSIKEMIKNLPGKRVIWLMVPPGKATENTIKNLSEELNKGDIVIDGGNSNYKDSIKRAEELEKKGIDFLDIGTSGGIWGLKEGYCLMAGGEHKAYEYIKPILKTLAPAEDKGYGYMGGSGAGHFVKMVHNGIEYGLMEAYAEGFELMQAKKELNLKLDEIAEIWRYGSVVRSWLLDLAADALKDNPDLKGVAAYAEDSGEGRWAVNEAIELAVPIPVISQALQARFRSRQEQPFSAKILAALRQQFGGHEVRKT